MSRMTLRFWLLELNKWFPEMESCGKNQVSGEKITGLILEMLSSRCL